MKSQNESSKYDFFISGRWRNKENILKLTHKIREKGYSVYCFLESPQSNHRLSNDPEEDMLQFEQREWQKDTYVKGIFDTDMQGERNSKAFILLLPAGKSCHIEAGVAYGMGKKCILIGEQKEAESLYLIFDEIYPSEEAFLTTL